MGEINPDIKVIRNDEMTIEEIEKLSPSHIILSPGPGKPSDAGICEDVVRAFQGVIPILGVCLGHQAICEVYGATVTYAKRLMHGKQSICTIENDKLFSGVGRGESLAADADGRVDSRKLRVARYHSLAAKEEGFPKELKVIAVADDDGEIMAVRHREYEVYGLQFHPESILTPEGMTILSNFLK